MRAVQNTTAIIALVGMPGCGKSTLRDALLALLPEMKLRVKCVNLDTPDSFGITGVLRRVANECLEEGNPRRSLLMWWLRLFQYEKAKRLLPEVDVLILDGSFETTRVHDQFVNAVPSGIFDWLEKSLALERHSTIFLDVSAKTALERKCSRTMPNIESAQRLWLAYQLRALQQSWIRINGEMPVDQIGAQAIRIIKDILPQAKMGATR